MLELKNFDFIGNLKVDEDSLLADFIENYRGSSQYFTDAFHEAADNAVPIYNYDVWKDAAEIQEFIEEALEEGLVSTDNGVDLISIFQAGYYTYFNQNLHQNVEIIAYNYLAGELNEWYSELDEAYQELADLIDIEQKVEDAAEGIDNNSYISDLDDILETIKEELEEEMEELAEDMA